MMIIFSDKLTLFFLLSYRRRNSTYIISPVCNNNTVHVKFSQCISDKINFAYFLLQITQRDRYYWFRFTKAVSQMASLKNRKRIFQDYFEYYLISFAWLRKFCFKWVSWDFIIDYENVYILQLLLCFNIYVEYMKNNSLNWKGRLFFWKYDL